LSYVIDYADELSNQELVFEQYGVKIIIDAEQLSFLKGLELDYRREGINAAFKFNNPNVIGTCGCGESFAVAKSLSTEN
jgi:iron-sulfur cluster assembly protein